MSARLNRKALLLGIVAVIVVGLVYFRTNRTLLHLEGPSFVPPRSRTESKVSEPWGKLSIGPVTGPPLSKWGQIRNIFYRLRSRYAGITIPIGQQVPLDMVMNFYYADLVPRPSVFVVYFSPGLNGSTAFLVPMTKTNSGRIISQRTSLDALLAFNGYSVVRLRRNVIKVFPSSMSDRYSDAPVNDLSSVP
jgi:hypothetical protein